MAFASIFSVSILVAVPVKAALVVELGVLDLLTEIGVRST
jgi:hypothetical protein